MTRTLGLLRVTADAWGWAIAAVLTVLGLLLAWERYETGRLCEAMRKRHRLDQKRIAALEAGAPVLTIQAVRPSDPPMFMVNQLDESRWSTHAAHHPKAETLVIVDVKAGPDARFATARFHTRPRTTDQIVVDEVWQDDCYRWHAALAGRYESESVWVAKSRTLVVDLGANVGAFSILAALSSATLVVAFEPDPDNIAAFERNLALNGFVNNDVGRWTHPAGGRVDVWPFAAGRHEGTVRFCAGSGGGQVHDSGSLLVNQFPLDQILANHYPRHEIAFVKCDIEGAELEALAGGPKTFGKAERIAMEYHSQLGQASWGDLVYELAGTHRVELIGRPQLGGLLYGTRL